MHRSIAPLVLSYLMPDLIYLWTNCNTSVPYWDLKTVTTLSWPGITVMVCNSLWMQIPIAIMRARKTYTSFKVSGYLRHSCALALGSPLETPFPSPGIGLGNAQSPFKSSPVPHHQKRGGRSQLDPCLPCLHPYQAYQCIWEAVE